jgi:hypothetical protein
MKSKELIRNMSMLVMFPSVLETYLGQCRVRHGIVEDTDTHVPPTRDEAEFLVRYLRSHGSKPMIVGSVGVLYHLGNVNTKKFRPTVDLDIWVTKVPELPSGWRRDPEAIGLTSWISPSGGYVDFLIPGHEYPGGGRNPSRLDVSPETADTRYPVASWKSLMVLKLATHREKDLSDLMSLVRKLGKVPTEAELGKLNRIQRENLDLIRIWFEQKPSGDYGE